MYGDRHSSTHGIVEATAVQCTPDAKKGVLFPRFVHYHYLVTIAFIIMIIIHSFQSVYFNFIHVALKDFTAYTCNENM